MGQTLSCASWQWEHIEEFPIKSLNLGFFGKNEKKTHLQQFPIQPPNLSPLGKNRQIVRIYPCVSHTHIHQPI